MLLTVAGPTGSGKTYQLLRLIRTAATFPVFQRANQNGSVKVWLNGERYSTTFTTAINPFFRSLDNIWDPYYYNYNGTWSMMDIEHIPSCFTVLSRISAGAHERRELNLINKKVTPLGIYAAYFNAHTKESDYESFIINELVCLITYSHLNTDDAEDFQEMRNGLNNVGLDRLQKAQQIYDNLCSNNWVPERCPQIPHNCAASIAISEMTFCKHSSNGILLSEASYDRTITSVAAEYSGVLSPQGFKIDIKASISSLKRAIAFAKFIQSSYTNGAITPPHLIFDVPVEEKVKTGIATTITNGRLCSQDFLPVTGVEIADNFDASACNYTHVSVNNEGTVQQTLTTPILQGTPTIQHSSLTMLQFMTGNLVCFDGVASFSGAIEGGTGPGGMKLGPLYALQDIANHFITEANVVISYTFENSQNIETIFRTVQNGILVLTAGSESSPALILAVSPDRRNYYGVLGIW